MKNQYSFRLTTTLLPSGTSAKTTQVINKVDSDGNKFYPNFTEETVVITNDDRTIMETTRATCTDGVLTFVKRGLADDSSEDQIENRKLTWNPGSLCFITAGASDWIDRDDDIVWSGDQTYAGDMESRGKATYKGRLITEKGVEYPHFDSLEDLQAYESPFGGMFAVVDSDGELYRYNAVSEEWSVVTTSTPVQPAQASDVAIGTVRVATDEEFEDGTEQGENDEFLLATIPQIKSLKPDLDLHIVDLNISSGYVSQKGYASDDAVYEVPRAGFLIINWTEQLYNGYTVNFIGFSGNAPKINFCGDQSFKWHNPGNNQPEVRITHNDLVPVGPGTFKVDISIASDEGIPQQNVQQCRVKIVKFFYFE